MVLDLAYSLYGVSDIMAEVILYHGSFEEVAFPEIRKSRYTKDFSWGFYCTNSYKQAYRWAYKRNRVGVVNFYRYTDNPKLKHLSFPKMTEEWLDFIAYCRNGGVHDYDIVEGPMADDTIWNYVSDFLNGDISREAFWVLAAFKEPTQQISMHSLQALNCLEFIKGEKADGR